MYEFVHFLPKLYEFRTFFAEIVRISYKIVRIRTFLRGEMYEFQSFFSKTMYETRSVSLRQVHRTTAGDFRRYPRRQTTRRDMFPRITTSVLLFSVRYGLRDPSLYHITNCNTFFLPHLQAPSEQFFFIRNRPTSFPSSRFFHESLHNPFPISFPVPFSTLPESAPRICPYLSSGQCRHLPARFISEDLSRAESRRWS
jgi:hypothetical protein